MDNTDDDVADEPLSLSSDTVRRRRPCRPASSLSAVWQSSSTVFSLKKESKVLSRASMAMGRRDLSLLALSQTPAKAARPRIRASASRSMPVSSPAFVGTH